MIPFNTTKECMKCHASYGFVENDLGGALSIKIDATNLLAKQNSNFVFVSLLTVSGIVMLIILIYFLFYNFTRDIISAEEKLYKMAVLDVLTGLYNRRKGLEILEKEIHRSRRTNSPLSILMFDIDYFKKINDTYGHLAGDEALRGIGDAISPFVRPYDILMRYGGEEFILILPNTSLKNAKNIAQRVRKTIQEVEITKNTPKTFSYTISIGCAQLQDDQNEDKLINVADNALYKAKQNGRNRVEW